MFDKSADAGSSQEYMSAGVCLVPLGSLNGGRGERRRLGAGISQNTSFGDTRPALAAQRRNIVWSLTPFSIYGCHVSALVGEQRRKGEFIFMQNEMICITREAHLQDSPQTLH